MTKVFVIPRRVRNPLVFSFEIRFPINAAWPLPSPGRKLQRGAESKEAKIGFFSFILGIEIICFGIVVLFFIDLIIIEEPNKPVRSGSKGSFRSSVEIA